jgi:hypothetical protein
VALTSGRLGARAASGCVTLGGREPREGAHGGAGRWYGAYGVAQARPAHRLARRRVPAVFHSDCYGLAAIFSKFLNRSAQSGE